METIEAIKPGPKPKKEDGSLDERRRVTPEKKEDYRPLNLIFINQRIDEL